MPQNPAQTTHGLKAGVTIIEIAITITLLATVSFLIYSVFSAQISLFVSQLAGINVSSQNQIAVNELIKQTRESVAVVNTCPNPPHAGCSADITGGNAIVFQVWGLDSSGDPTSAYFDYIVYRQDPLDGTKLIRKTFTDSQSSRLAESKKIIATDIQPNGGLSIVYTPDINQATQVKFSVTTTKQEAGKTQSKTQEARANLRNSTAAAAPPPPAEPPPPVPPPGAPPPPPPDPLAFDNSSTGNCSSWQHTTAGTNRLLLVHVTAGGGGPIPTATYAGVPLTLLDYGTAGYGNVSHFVFYLQNPAPALGTNTVQVTNGLNCAATSYRGTTAIPVSYGKSVSAGICSSFIQDGSGNWVCDPSHGSHPANCVTRDFDHRLSYEYGTCSIGYAFSGVTTLSGAGRPLVAPTLILNNITNSVGLGAALVYYDPAVDYNYLFGLDYTFSWDSPNGAKYDYVALGVVVR